MVGVKLKILSPLYMELPKNQDEGLNISVAKNCLRPENVPLNQGLLEISNLGMAITRISNLLNK